jgi:hypothetical protein
MSLDVTGNTRVFQVHCIVSEYSSLALNIIT